MTLFDPILEGASLYSCLDESDVTYIKLQGMIFCRREIGKFNTVLEGFLNDFGAHINMKGTDWPKFG